MEKNLGEEIRGNWNAELVGSELKFWDTWFKSKGLHWPDDYRFRLDMQTELQDWIVPYLPNEEVSQLSILDVGSGPLTLLGKNLNGKPLNIQCCDALGKFYRFLLTEYGIEIPAALLPFECEMESLGQHYRLNQFDLVHAQNCVDHSYDPLMAIHEMISVCKPGGKVLLRHEQNEAEREGYQGLHQWNFNLVNEEFVIGSKFGTQLVRPIIQDIWGEQVQFKSWVDGQHQITIITKEN